MNMDWTTSGDITVRDTIIICYMPAYYYCEVTDLHVYPDTRSVFRVPNEVR